jgi:hypothetical protein
MGGGTRSFCFITGCQAQDGFGAGQDFLRVEPFFRGAFEPGHFAVASVGEPLLELAGGGGGGGGGESAVIKSQFPRVLSDGLLHRRRDLASLN